MIDTRATVSCFSSEYARKLIEEGKHLFERFRISLRPADGTNHSTVGSVTTTVTFRGRSKPVKCLIIPELTQNLYLGADFVRTFELAKDLFDDVSYDNDNNNMDEEQVDEDFHIFNDTQITRLASVINSFPSFAKEGLGRTSLITHVIDTGENKPIKQRHFAVSPAVEQLMFEEIDRMLRLGVIEESQSPWSSPVTLVRKPGKVRLCLDARKVNNVTVKDAYPLPLIDGILSRLPKARFITSLDLKDAFWQIPLDERSR